MGQTSSSGRKYGWKRDLYDIRDKHYKVCNKSKKDIKQKVDLRKQMIPVFDQGSLASCNANAICSVINPDFEPSRMFIYYHERANKAIDEGGSPRDCLKSINRNGMAEEKNFKYNPLYPNSTPTCEVHNIQLKYKRLNGKSLRDIQACLSKGNPFIFGFNVYSSFEDPLVWNPKIDQMPIPNPNKDKLLGGHVAVAVGYSDRRKCIIVRNSWGPEWGLDGHFFMPYKYITSEQCDDFWVVTSGDDTFEIVVKDDPLVTNKGSDKVTNKGSGIKDKGTDIREIMITKEDVRYDRKRCLLRDD